MHARAVILEYKGGSKLVTSKGALSGIKILSFAQLAQGNAGVEYLADLGADVIKIERPGKGAWERSWSGLDTYINGSARCMVRQS